MEVAFAGRTLAEIAGYDARRDVGVWQGLKFEGVGCSRRLGDLSGEGGRNCMLLVFNEIGLRSMGKPN